MKTILIAILTFVSTITFVQQITVWQGGTPGNETNWNEPKNWSTNTVPDEFSDVYIHDVSSSTFSSPVLGEGQVEVNSIRVASNAQLTINPEASVVVYGYTQGLTNKNVTMDGALLVMGEGKNPQLETLSLVKYDKE